MTLSFFRQCAVCAMAAISFSSCGPVVWNEILFPHNLPHHAAFNEAEFAALPQSGSGSVRGKLSETFKDGSRYDASNTKVVLAPATSYTTEIFQRKYANGAYLARPDPRYAKYVRTTLTDDHGNFRFTGVPPGEYYVGSKVAFPTTTEFTDSDGNTSEGPETHIWRNYARVSVQNGQTITISDWSSGPERITNP